jgi:hypothetical protein
MQAYSPTVIGLKILFNGIRGGGSERCFMGDKTF